jgi:GTP-binding protein YchF
VVQVPDTRLAQLEKIVDAAKIIPNILRITDIAGLVKGASKGEGLGNQFLSHIRQVDAIAHLVRCFEDDNIVHVEGKIDPVADIDLIHIELILADLEQVERKLERVRRQSKGDKKQQALIPFYEALVVHLGDGQQARDFKVTDDNILLLEELNLITAKPYFYVLNVAENDLLVETSAVKSVQARAKKEDVNCVKICCKLEAELAEMPPEEQKEFFRELGIANSGLDQIVKEGFDLLNQITFFTAGPKEVRAWNVDKGALAPQAAGKIHSDIERGFIRAEVYHFDDAIEYGSEAEVKNRGRLRTEGKDYIIQDGDIVHFRFNV